MAMKHNTIKHSKIPDKTCFCQMHQGCSHIRVLGVLEGIYMSIYIYIYIKFKKYPLVSDIFLKILIDIYFENLK